jgi:hypothetical protein
MLPATVVGLFVHSGELAGGVLAWTAGLTMLRQVAPRQLALVGVLTLLGALGMVLSATRGAPPDWQMVLTANQMLITLLVAVSFLRLVAGPRDAGGRRKTGVLKRGPRRSLWQNPQGRRAVWQSMLSVHLLGAVINISVVDIVGERLLAADKSRRGPLLLISRAYSSGAFWSPFWGAAAAVFTYAPAARLSVLIAVGALAAAIGLTASAFTVAGALDDVRNFRGFPLSVEFLLVPLTLVVAVLSAHALLPALPVSGVITVCSLSLTLIALSPRGVRTMVSDLSRHAVTRLPLMRQELTLFLAAGAMAAGFSELTDSFGLWLPFARFGPLQAYLLLLVMVSVSMVGIHPVITIAASAGLLHSLHPDPTLFAMTGLLAWGIQAAGGPLSGLNVVMHSRFGIDSFTLARWNAKYVVGCLVMAAGLLPLCDVLSKTAMT